MATFVDDEKLASGSTRRITHRAGQIAGRSDFDESDTGVLFVFRAKSTVERASFVGKDSHLERQFRRHRELMAIVPAHVAANEVFAFAVGGAPLSKINSASPRNDLCRNER